MSRSALLSLAVFGLLLLLVLASGDKRVSVGVRTLELPETSADAITRIAITGSSNTTLRRDGESWTVEDPAAPDVRRSADARLAEALAKALAELSIAGFVTGRAESHGELEIDDETGLSVRVDSADGPGLDVVFGRSSKKGGDLIRKSGEDAVFETRSAVALRARRDVDEWRRRKIADLSAAEVGALRIESAGRDSLRLERGAGDGADEWTLAAGPTLPEGFVFEAAIAVRAVNALASLRAEDFLDEGELGEPATVLVAEDAAGNTLAEFRVGAADSSGRRPIELAGDSQRYLISSSRFDAIAPNLEALRDLSLLRGGVDTLSKVVVSHAGKTFKLEKIDGQWQPATTVDGSDFDPSRVDPRMAALGRAQGVRVLSPTQAAAADFSDAVLIALTNADGSERTIRFGGPLASESGRPEVAVESSDGFRYAAAAADRNRYMDPAILFARPPAAPPGRGGPPQGLENLPPDIRRQIEAQLRQQGAP